MIPVKFLCLLLIILFNVSITGFTPTSLASNHGGTLGIHFSDGKETANSDVMQRYSLLWSFDTRWQESDFGYLTERWELSHTRWQLWLQGKNTGWTLNPVFRYVIPARSFTAAKNLYYFFDASIGVVKLDHRGFEKRDLGSKW